MAGRYVEAPDDGAFGLLVSALHVKNGGDPNIGCTFPRDDALDLSNGARSIPDAVTLARRAGKKVKFVTNGSPRQWYWEMPDGTHVHHKM